MKKEKLQLLVTLLITVCCVNLLFAQAPGIAWKKNFGGNGDDEPFAGVQTDDGGAIAAGWTTSNNGDVTGFQGLWDIWVSKVDKDGNLQWQKALGGSMGDEAWSINKTSDGGYIVLGFTDSNDGDVGANKGGLDFWIVKLDNSGNISWKKVYGGSNNDSAHAIIQTSDGGYTVAGSTSSNDGDASGNGLHGGSDFWILKMDGSGNISWQKAYGGNKDEVANTIAQTTDGGYIVGGYAGSNNNGDVGPLHSPTYWDAWAVKLDASGNISWQKTLGGEYNEAFHSVKQTSDGGYIFGGYSNSSTGDLTQNKGGSDYWTVKTDNNGTIQWQKSLGGNDNDVANSMIITSDGGYLIGGYAASANGDVTGNHGFDDYWVAKLNSSGALSWQLSLGGSDVDLCYGVDQTSDGGFIISGSAISNDGDIAGNGKGFKDFWIVKLNAES